MEPYIFGNESEYELILATDINQRCRAWTLVHEAYQAKGYVESAADGLWYNIHDALPETKTFLVTRDGKDVATLTLVVDSPIHVPADSLYEDELDKLRAQGRRPAEIISLASKETDRRRCIEVLRHMFRAAYQTARKIMDATDLVVTVNPHHAAYYEKRLLFVRCGEERSYEKVAGAAAVLLRLDFDRVDERYEARYGTKPGSVYHFFCTDEKIDLMLNLVRASQRPLPEASVVEYFVVNRPLLRDVAAELQEHIFGQYAEEETMELFPIAQGLSA